MFIIYHPVASDGKWGGFPFLLSCPPTLLCIKARQDFDTLKVLKAKRKQVEENIKPNLALFISSVDYKNLPFLLSFAGHL